MLTDGQGTLWRKNIAENFNHLSRAHTYSEHELEFTFAKNGLFTESSVTSLGSDVIHYK